ncbi:fimbrillin family protein [Sphingobacterium sp. SYP-B4668]|uniref:fimbrillin family protein n=1 Tax=Sphingobacterium sp. SYP-B4668 TaxID=2996035 RepID=UPI0022DCFB25|nr:fimbrillin family protein [Sphingobacterium sp. SYP-B4668]
MNRNIINPKRIFGRLSNPIAIILLILVVTGCKKDISEQPGYGEGAKIVIKVEGVTGDVLIEKLGSVDGKLATKSSSVLGGSSRRSTPINANESGFGFEFISEQGPIASSPSPSTEKLASVGPSFRSSTGMTPNFTYRILIYDKSTGVLSQTIEAKAGTEVKLDATKGKTYTWYAYSYNNTETINAPTNTATPTVDAPVNKDLLYASGEIAIPVTTPGQYHEYPLAITFKHKMAQVRVRIDGTMLGRYADINTLKASFTNIMVIKSGTFDIKNNTMDNFQDVVLTDIFNSTTPNPTNVWEADYYTADPSNLTSYKVKITDLTVTFRNVDPSVATVNITTFTNSSIPVAPNIEDTFNFSSPIIGQRLTGVSHLSYTPSSKRILHVSSDATYGYSLQRGAGWQMVNDTRNFGTLPTSLVRMQPWAAGQGVWIGGNTTDDKANWLNATASVAGSNAIIAKLTATDVNQRPDIIIFGYDQYYMSPALQDELVSFLNRGGVFIMMNEFLPTAHVPSFLNKLFGTGTAIDVRSLTGAGSMYPLLNVDDRVLNGPFGDARSKLWGEDASTSVGVTGLPVNDVVIYSYGQAINRPLNSTNAAAVSMFRHKTKNFFYLGDGGLVSYDGGTSSTICPFAFDASTGRPLSKPYGNAGNGYADKSQNAYNGIIAGNIMLWAAELAEFKGTKKWRYAP